MSTDRPRPWWLPHATFAAVLVAIVLAGGLIISEPDVPTTEPTLPATVYVNPLPPATTTTSSTTTSTTVAASVPTTVAPTSTTIDPTVRPAQVIYIPEDYDVPFDAQRGDTIIVIMYPDGDPEARCLDMGGEPIFNPWTDIHECDGVDF